MFVSTGKLASKYGISRHILVKWFESGKVSGILTSGNHVKIEEESLKTLLGKVEG